MSLPILQPNSNSNPPQVRGEVTIEPSVIMSAGVILNATPGHKIIIHAGVCLGMGTIITAHEGDVIIEANAILGPGTLILGNCRIGSQSSLGTSVTVYHAQVEKLAVIPAGTILGDNSRQLNLKEQKTVIIDRTSEEEQVEEVTQNTPQPVAVEEKSEPIVDKAVEDYQPPNQDISPSDFSPDSIIDKINQLNKNNHSSRTVNHVSSESQSKPWIDETISSESGKSQTFFPDKKCFTRVRK